jgi:hypothetical protein
MSKTLFLVPPKPFLVPNKSAPPPDGKSVQGFRDLANEVEGDAFIYAAKAKKYAKVGDRELVDACRWLARDCRQRAKGYRAFADVIEQLLQPENRTALLSLYE